MSVLQPCFWSQNGQIILKIIKEGIKLFQEDKGTLVYLKDQNTSSTIQEE